MCIDIECGVKRSLGTSECYYSDAEEEEEVDSCYSQFYSDEVIEDGCLSRASSVADSDCSVIQDDNNNSEVDVVIFHNLSSKQHKKNNNKKKNVVVVVEEKEERICRICHLSLHVVSSSSDNDDHHNNNQSKEEEAVIELGCCCKDDLAVAHKHCALTWFNLKGNKTCEICNSIVSNLVVPNETPQGSMHLVNPEAETTTAATSHLSTRGGGGDWSCINGHRLLNFILACLVFAFVISWLFHFNIPS